MEDQSNLIKQELEYLGKRAELSRNIIMRMSLQPNERKEAPVFSAARVAEMLERTPASVGRVAKELGLAAGPDPEEARHSITQAGLDKLREHYHLVSSKPEGGAKVIVIENQKGGVGKTTTVAHLAPWAALHGYRTLVIDADSQASFTAYQGLNPDIELYEEDTISPILQGDVDDVGKPASLVTRIKKAPHIENLWFVPSCLDLANGDVGAYKRQFLKEPGDDYVFFNRLKLAIDEIRQDYDLIIIDCPPHISAITYNSVYAADMMLIPLGAHMLDLASTARFIDWLKMVMDQLPGAAISRIRFMITNYDEKPASQDNLKVIRQVLGEHVLKVTALHSSEIQRAGALFKSIYEVPKAIGSRDAWSRACRTMDAVNREVMSQIEDLWAGVPPSGK
jgi:chromosome partitioning protein